jgi:hypothetical protein
MLNIIRVLLCGLVAPKRRVVTRKAAVAARVREFRRAIKEERMRLW